MIVVLWVENKFILFSSLSFVNIKNQFYTVY